MRALHCPTRFQPYPANNGARAREHQLRGLQLLVFLLVREFDSSYVFLIGDLA